MDFQTFFTDLANSAGGFGFKQILPAIAVLVIGLLVRKWILVLVKKQMDSKPNMQNIAPALNAIISIALIILIIIIVCSMLQIPMSSLVALLSVFTLAISMAAQGILSNIAGGMSILYSKPFVVGDYISTSGADGTVTEIGLFYTRLKTFDQKVISVPNSTIASAIVTDFSTNPTRRLDLTISASYDDDPALVMSALKELVSAQEKILPDPAPFVNVMKYGSSAIDYVVRVYVKAPDYFEVNFALLNGFAETFKAHGIHMTYDHINVHMIKEDEE